MTTTPPRRVGRGLGLLAWALAAALAGTLAWWAVTFVASGNQGEGDGVLSADQVGAALAQERAAAAAATPLPDGTPTTPVAGTASSGPASGERVVRTWDVAGGELGVACADTSITLLYATPRDGWSVEVNGTGPEEVEVSFRRGEAKTEVHSWCDAGRPELRTDTEDD